jgi:mitogen-activated protein kinase kinase
MLLQHAWLAPLIKPHTIAEEDEEEAEAEAQTAAAVAADKIIDGTDEAAAAISQATAEPVEIVFDKEVADWVKGAIEKRKKGTLGKGAQKPALHAAPLDAVPSPSANGVNGSELPVTAEAATAST